MAEIAGGPERYVQIGSSVHLTCTIKDYTEPPTYVFWYHAEHMVNYDSNKRVSVGVWHEYTGGTYSLTHEDIISFEQMHRHPQMLHTQSQTPNHSQWN